MKRLGCLPHPNGDPRQRTVVNPPPLLQSWRTPPPPAQARTSNPGAQPPAPPHGPEDHRLDAPAAAAPRRLAKLRVLDRSRRPRQHTPTKKGKGPRRHRRRPGFARRRRGRGRGRRRFFLEKRHAPDFINKARPSLFITHPHLPSKFMRKCIFLCNISA